MEPKWRNAQLWAAVLVALAAFLAASAEIRLRPEGAAAKAVEAEEVGLSDYVLMVVDFLWRPNESSYEHVWPVILIFFLSIAYSSLLSVFS